MLRERLGGTGTLLVVFAVPAMAVLTLNPWNLGATSASEETSAQIAVSAEASQDDVLDLSGWEYTGHSQHANGKGKGHQGQGKGAKQKKSPSGPPPHAGKGGPPPHAGKGGPPPHAGKGGPPPHAKNKK